MFIAFASPAAFTSRRTISPLCDNRSLSDHRSQTRPRFSMASIYRPQQKNHVIDFDEPDTSSTKAPPEIAAIAATVCEFMNKEHVRDIASYVVQFGKKFDDLSQLSGVRLTGLDAAGFTADVISCDDSSHCVCVQERLEWPMGLCHNATDIIAAFKHLSILCGLPADF